MQEGILALTVASESDSASASVYSGIMGAIQGDGIGLWRSGSRKVIFVISDATPLDEPITGKFAQYLILYLVLLIFFIISGYTYDSVIEASSNPATSSEWLKKRNINGISISSLVISSNETARVVFSRLAAATNGESSAIQTTSGIADSITQAVKKVVATIKGVPTIQVTINSPAEPVPRGAQFQTFISLFNPSPFSGNVSLLVVWPFANASCDPLSNSKVSCKLSYGFANISVEGGIGYNQTIQVKLNGVIPCEAATSTSYDISALVLSQVGNSSFTSSALAKVVAGTASSECIDNGIINS